MFTSPEPAFRKGSRHFRNAEESNQEEANARNRTGMLVCKRVSALRQMLVRLFMEDTHNLFERHNGQTVFFSIYMI